MSRKFPQTRHPGRASVLNAFPWWCKVRSGVGGEFLSITFASCPSRVIGATKIELDLDWPSTRQEGGERVNIRRRGRVHMTRNEYETYLHIIRRSGLGHLPASVHVMPKNHFSRFFLGWAELVLLRTLLNNCIGERSSRTVGERFELTWSRISRGDSTSGGSRWLRILEDERCCDGVYFGSSRAIDVRAFQSSAHRRPSNNFQQPPQNPYLSNPHLEKRSLDCKHS